MRYYNDFPYVLTIALGCMCGFGIGLMRLGHPMLSFYGGVLLGAGMVYAGMLGYYLTTE